MVFSCSRTNTVSFINKEGVELFQIGKDKTYNTVFIKDNNSVAVSSGGGVNRCAINVRVHGNNCHDILTFSVYYSYTSINSPSR
jgi:hypothetical protein